VVTFSSVSASELAEGSWKTKTSMNQTMFGFSVAVVDEQIYVIGGLNYRLSFTEIISPFIFVCFSCFSPFKQLCC
jgi:hypothetical protein